MISKKSTKKKGKGMADVDKMVSFKPFNITTPEEEDNRTFPALPFEEEFKDYCPVKFFPHQIQALRWMHGIEKNKKESEKHVGGILGDVMGLGKTIDTLGAVYYDMFQASREPAPARPTHSTLIVTTLTLTDHWKSEALALFKLSSEDVMVYHGSRRFTQLNKLYEAGKFPLVVITTYETVQQDFAKRRQESHLFRTRWKRVALDEAHVARNAKTKTFRALKQFNTFAVWCITGTPIVNYPEDVRMLSILCTPNNPLNYTSPAQEITWKRKHLLRRDKDMLNLPPIEVRFEWVNMTQSEEERYRKLEEWAQHVWDTLMENETLPQEYQKILLVLVRLRQWCDHPLLQKGHSVTSKLLERVKLQLGIPLDRPQRRTQVINNNNTNNNNRTINLDVDPNMEDMIDVNMIEDGIESGLPPNNDIPELICKDPPKSIGSKEWQDCLEKMRAMGKNSENCDSFEHSDSEEPDVEEEDILDDDMVEEIVIDDLESFQVNHKKRKLDFNTPYQKSLIGEKPRQKTKHVESPKPKRKWEEVEDDSSNDRFPTSPREKKKLIIDFAQDGSPPLVISKSDDEDNTNNCNQTGIDEEDVKELKDDPKALEEKAKISAAKLRESLLAISSAPEDPTLANQDPNFTEYEYSSKMVKLLEILKQIRDRDNKEKSVIFSQFTTMLDVIECMLLKEGFNVVRFDGRQRPETRKKIINIFRTSENCTIFLASLKAGGVGVNLLPGCNLFMVDPWWNISVELQANDRIHRIGQTKKVTIYRLLVAKTIEEDVLKIQDKKLNQQFSFYDDDRKKILSLREINCVFTTMKARQMKMNRLISAT